MKKRAQRPDAYTFTILFRGLSYARPSIATGYALSIYQSMFAENSPVRPSIIHTNAVLQICALAHDVDALLGIAAELPTRGNGAPDNLTFTITLNALPSNAIFGPHSQNISSGEEDPERKEARALAIQHGRRLWVDIRQRWLSGDLRMDEKLVCAMGRLLLLGSKAQDHDDVLSLLEQTMGIPRQVARVARVSDRALGRAEEAREPNDSSELLPYSPASIELESIESPPIDEDDFPEPSSDPFAPLPIAAGHSQPAIRPSHNTLSLVLDACIRLNCIRAAQNYWGLLTSPDGCHKINPDTENYHMYLRLLRLQRSSRLAVELVDEMRSGHLTGKVDAVQTKTFRIALSCCLRDAKNRNSVLHAEKLVKMMTDTLPYPDAKALRMYLRLALNQKPRDWRIIMGVIRGTELGLRNLRSLLAYDPAGPQKQNEEDILELVRELVGAFDVVLNLGNEELNGEEKKRCREQRSTLTAYLTRIHNRFVAESKSVEVRRREDEDTGEMVTAIKNSRIGRRSNDYRKVDEEGGNNGFAGEDDRATARRPAEEGNHGVVGPGKGEWKRERKMRGVMHKKERWDNAVRGGRVDSVMSWRSHWGRNVEGAIHR